MELRCFAYWRSNHEEVAKHLCGCVVAGGLAYRQGNVCTTENNTKDPGEPPDAWWIATCTRASRQLCNARYVLSTTKYAPNPRTQCRGTNHPGAVGRTTNDHDFAGKLCSCLSTKRTRLTSPTPQTTCVIELGGYTAFRSHSNSNMLTHPARGRWSSNASCSGAAMCWRRIAPVDKS